jgi:prepilin-type N-terminal cleavage/methylation domain-containing protein
MNLGTRAFTLIELLVVIAIIAILASFATPTIGSAIERGRSAKCVSNLRQIGVAVQQYIADNDNTFPSIRIEGEDPVPGQEGSEPLDVLGPYGVTAATLTCPNDAALGAESSLAKYRTSYMFSPIVDGENAINPKIYSRRGIFSVSNVGRLTVASDFTGIHPRRAVEEDTRFLKNGMNVLKADGRVIQR